MRGVKILVVAESFLPHMNGVTNSVLRVVECFARSGHEVRIVAPGAPGIPNELTFGAERVPVIPVLSLPMMGYGQVRMSATTNYRIRSIIDDFHPDVVHLACPALLGNAASKAAVKRGIPTVAIYQTDLPGYTRKYGAPVLEEAMWMFLRDIHNRCEVNLAPSSSTRNQIVEHGIERVQIWRRGVDTSQFSPTRRSEKLRKRLAPNGEKLVVYVGRLAAEKQVDDLAVLESMPNVRLVIVGEGPSRRSFVRPCQAPILRASRREPNSQKSLPRATSSCIRVSSRRSARRSKRPWPQASPRSHLARVARSTSLTTRTRVGSTRQASLTSFARTSRIFSVTTRNAGISLQLRRNRCGSGRGPFSRSSFSAFIARRRVFTRPRTPRNARPSPVPLTFRTTVEVTV